MYSVIVNPSLHRCVRKEKCRRGQLHIGLQGKAERLQLPGSNINDIQISANLAFNRYETSQVTKANQLSVLSRHCPQFHHLLIRRMKQPNQVV